MTAASATTPARERPRASTEAQIVDAACACFERFGVRKTTIEDIARQAEVEAAVTALADGLPFPIARAGSAGWGVGQTLTARGRLTHAVHVVDGRVAR